MVQASAQESKPSDTPRAVHDPTGGPAVMMRVLAMLAVAGPTLALVWLAVPHSPRVDETGILAVAIVAYAFAAFPLIGLERLPWWAFQGVMVSGIGLITLAIYFGGEATTAFAMFYVWATIYAFYFLPLAQAVFYIGLIAAAYGAALLVLDQPESTPVARWLITVGTLVVVGLLTQMLKSRIERLIASLAEAARTDVLTGLLNRRGFQELFDLEVERALRAARPLSLLVGDLDGLKQVNDTLGHTAGDSALERVAGALRRAKRRIDTAARIGGDEFALVVPETGAHGTYILAERLRHALRDEFASDPTPLTISFGIASFPGHERTSEGLLRTADQAMYAAKELGGDRSVIHSAEAVVTLVRTASRRAASEGHLAPLLALAETLDIRDAGTPKHSQTVARYAQMMARELGLPGPAQENVRLAGILHDMGKVAVPDSVLRKPGPLSEDEWTMMRKHPEIGAHILEGADLDRVREWVLDHHERPDGRGYPRGLATDEIPLEAQILAVADAYETMTSDRVYRPALGRRRAREELEQNAGTQFDERVVQALLAALEHEPERVTA